MNFFRDVTRRRRSSSASSAGEVSPTMGSKLPCDKKQQLSGGKDPHTQQNQSSYMNIGGKHVALSSIGATATLRRVFLPRSRTTGFQQSNSFAEERNRESKIKNQSKNPIGDKDCQNNIPAGGNGIFQNFESSGRSFPTKSYRSESLGRNVNKRKRSSTVPNFQDDNAIHNMHSNDQEENVNDSLSRPSSNRRPFSTFFQTNQNDISDSVLQLSETHTAYNAQVATISRSSKNSNDQSTLNEQSSSMYASTDVTNPQKFLHVNEENGSNMSNMESGREVYQGNNAKHAMTFGAQKAGGINLRRGRNNLRPLSADVSLLTSEGRKIGKQDKSIEKEDSKSSVPYHNPMYRKVDSGNEDRSSIRISSINVNKRQSNTILSTSNSEFFRVIQEGTRDMNELRDHSLESLLDSEDQTYLAPSSISGKMTASNTQNSISTLNSLDYVIDDEDTYFNDGRVINKSATSTSISTITESVTEETLENINPQTKDMQRPQSTFGSLQMKVQELKAQLDVLKITGAETSSQCLQKALDRVVTSNNIQQVQKSNYSRTAPPTTLPPPPPIDNLRSKNQSLQHPNTPAQGFEHMLPPNIINNQVVATDSSNTDCSTLNSSSFPSSERNSNDILFPLLASNDLFSLSNPSSTGSGSSDASMSAGNTPQEHIQLLQFQHALLLQQQCLNNTSSGPDTTDSLSPPTSPLLGKRKSGSNKNQALGSKNLNLLPGNSLITVPIRLPLSVASNAPYGYNGSLSSSSPSTLSPCSSNSTLPPTIPQSASSNQVNQQQPATTNHVHQSTNRPQGLKLPQSQSLNVFPSASLIPYQPPQSSTPSEHIDKVFFFFDVITTQDKIAKVRRWCCLNYKENIK